MRVFIFVEIICNRVSCNALGWGLFSREAAVMAVIVLVAGDGDTHQPCGQRERSQNMSERYSPLEHFVSVVNQPGGFISSPGAPSKGQ